MIKHISIVLAAATVVACAPQPRQPDESVAILVAKSLDSLTAAVACAHPEAARVGAATLAAGGNAVDAAIAIQWALAVCFPEAGNIGGGGFMVARMADGTTTTLDFREKAPAAAHRDIYLQPNGDPVPGLSLETHLSTGVPGTVMGLFEANTRYGSLPMSALMAPAIELAERGFTVTSIQANNLNRYRDKFLQRNRAPVAFVRGDRPWQGGDTLVQPELAATLKRIRDGGAHAFYHGDIARLTVQEMEAGSGLITATDLADYRAVWREAFVVPFDKYTIYTMPPPSSGGVVLAQILGMYADCFADPLAHNSVEYIHALTECQRRAYADRAHYLGDPDFTTVPTAALTHPLYLRSRIVNFSWAAATPSASISHGEVAPFGESPETTHLSVVDAQGNAVSVTTTINDLYGSGIVVSGAGYLLNNEMDDFSAKPGVPNLFGMVGGEANAIEPGKRMLSSMTPVVVLREGELFLVAGSPGGSTIITSVLQTVLNTTLHGMSLRDATAAPKFHSQWLPDEIVMEQGRFDDDTRRRLEALGHRIREVQTLGRVDAIRVLAGGWLEAVGDPRGDNTAAGYKKR